MAQFILIIFVTMSPGQTAQVFKLSGNWDYQTCRALINSGVQEALQVYPGASVTGQCLQMTPK